MSKEKKIIITSNSVMFATKRQSYTVRPSHPFFHEIKEACQRGDTGGAYRLYAKKERGESKLVIKGNDLWFDEKKFDTAFAEAYAIAKDHGAGYAAMELFFTNLAANPNPISVEAFTAFMAKTRMPMTDRGTFLAYRRCNNEWTDHHTRSFDNRPGAVCRMKRSDCDAVQSNTCSRGFHICAHTYLSNFTSGPDLVVEINPRDVVAVPPDYDLSKMRVSNFRVLCTLPYFKDRIANHWQDALARIPFFLTAQTTEWDFMSGVGATHRNREMPTYMTAEDWLALEPL